MELDEKTIKVQLGGDENIKVQAAFMGDGYGNGAYEPVVFPTLLNIFKSPPLLARVNLPDSDEAIVAISDLSDLFKGARIVGKRLFDLTDEKYIARCCSREKEVDVHLSFGDASTEFNKLPNSLQEEIARITVKSSPHSVHNNGIPVKMGVFKNPLSESLCLAYATRVISGATGQYVDRHVFRFYGDNAEGQRLTAEQFTTAPQ